MFKWIFDWVNVPMIEATPAQEIKGMVVIIVSLVLMWVVGIGIGNLIEKLSEWLDKRGWKK